MRDHALHKTVVERREYPMVVRDGKLEIDYSDNGQFLDEDPQATIKCICGERFRSEDRAIEHLEDAEK